MNLYEKKKALLEALQNLESCISTILLFDNWREWTDETARNRMFDLLSSVRQAGSTVSGGRSPTNDSSRFTGPPGSAPNSYASFTKPKEVAAEFADSKTDEEEYDRATQTYINLLNELIPTLNLAREKNGLAPLSSDHRSVN